MHKISNYKRTLGYNEDVRTETFVRYNRVLSINKFKIPRLTKYAKTQLNY